MQRSHWLIVGTSRIAIVAVWIGSPHKAGDDHESLRMQQERQTEHQQSPPTSDEHRDPGSGAGSGSDSMRGKTGVRTGTAK